MPNIIRYWDLSVDERAALTVEQVETLTRVELMENGVLSPQPPVLLPADPPPTEKLELLCPTVAGTRYGSQSVPVGFRTLEDLRAFVALRPVFIDDDWTIDAKVGIPIDGAEESKSVQAIAKHETERRRSELERAKANKESNIKENQRYTEEVRASQKALEGIWADYELAKSRAQRLQRVRDTFQEYLGMSGGNEEIARSFLSKAKGFDSADIYAAIGIPDSRVVEMPVEIR